MSDNVQTIKDFIAAWSNLDSDELVGYFSEDGIYYNMPTQPVQGKEQLKQLLEALQLTGQKLIGTL